MSNDFKIGTLGNEEISGRSQNWVEASPITHLSSSNKTLVIAVKIREY